VIMIVVSDMLFGGSRNSIMMLVNTHDIKELILCKKNFLKLLLAGCLMESSK
jgi:hypothetical protein